LDVIPIPTPLGRSFFEEIQGSFSEPSMGSDMWVRLSYLAGLMVVLVMVGLVVNHYRNKAKDNTLPSGNVTNPQLVRKILNQALAARNRFDVNFHMEPGRIQATACALRRLDKTAMSLEAGTLKVREENWVGKPVQVFFHITSGKKHTLFYSYLTEILDVQKSAEGLTLLILRTPNELELGSMRSYLRVEPPYEYILGLSLWPEIFHKDGSEETSPAKWGRPLLGLDESRSLSPHLDNISAKGMRLIVPRIALKEVHLSFKTSQRLFFLLELHNPATEQKLRFWLRCRVENVFEDVKVTEVGLQFLQSGGFKTEDDPDLTWLDVGEDGIEILGNWIMARHLELFRKTGMA
jgi:hypothetical protein